MSNIDNVAPHHFVLSVPRTSRKKIGQVIKSFGLIKRDVGGNMRQSQLRILWIEDDDGSQRFTSVVHDRRCASGEIRISSRDARITQTAALAVYLKLTSEDK